MKDIKPRLRETLPYAAVGWALSIPVTEFYVHLGKAHWVQEFSKGFNTLGMVATRLSGIDATAFAVAHRKHHSPAASREATHGIIRLIQETLSSGLVGDKTARALLREPDAGRWALFPGTNPDNDPAIRIAEDGMLEPRYQNHLDEVVGRHPSLRVAGFGCLVAACYAVDRIKKVDIDKASVAQSAVNAASLSISIYAGHVIGGAVPEIVLGYGTGNEAGRDLPLLEPLLGNQALHHTHHKRPHLVEPTSTGLRRDGRVLRLFQRLGLAREPEHQVQKPEEPRAA